MVIITPPELAPPAAQVHVVQDAVEGGGAHVRDDLCQRQSHVQALELSSALTHFFPLAPHGPEAHGPEVGAPEGQDGRVGPDETPAVLTSTHQEGDVAHLGIISVAKRRDEELNSIHIVRTTM